MSHCTKILKEVKNRCLYKQVLAYFDVVPTLPQSYGSCPITDILIMP